MLTRYNVSILTYPNKSNSLAICKAPPQTAGVSKRQAQVEDQLNELLKTQEQVEEERSVGENF